MPPLSSLHHSLLTWYEQFGRKDLPWRNTTDPYAIYVSEVMLQQTQVKTVLERYYFPFLKQFPTLSALAGADVQEVLKAWEGLGYYSRARHLHQAAILAAPTLPHTAEALMALPGIGLNTAHAILAFAFGQNTPVMEANVKRILCRFFALKQPTPHILWQKATALLNPNNPYDHNQAMMDIGALICTTKQPACLVCPLKDHCRGKHDPLSYPQRKAKKEIPTRIKHIILWKDDHQRYLLTKRTSRFLHGLYGFVQYDALPHTLTPILLGEVSQIYSHFKLNAFVYQANASDTLSLPDPAPLEWFGAEELHSIPLSEVDHKIIRTFL